MPRIAAALAVFATATFCIGFNIVRYPVVWEKLALSGSFCQTDDSVEPETAEPIADYSTDSDSDSWIEWDEDSDDQLVVASIAGPADEDESASPWGSPSARADLEANDSYSYDSYSDDSYSDDSYTYGSYSDDSHSDDSYSGDDFGATHGSEDKSTNRRNRAGLGGGKKSKKPKDDGDNPSKPERPGETPADDPREYDYDSEKPADALEEPVEASPWSKYASSAGGTVGGTWEPAGADSWDSHDDLVPVTHPAESSFSAAESDRQSFASRQAGTARRSMVGQVRRLPDVDVWAPNPSTDEPPLRGNSIRFYPTTGIE